MQKTPLSRTPPLSRRDQNTHYRIRHHTRFQYSESILESFMEAWMEPLDNEAQHLMSFSIKTDPQTRIMRYLDSQGNPVNHFNVPAQHNRLRIETEAVVEKRPAAPLPSSLTSSAWKEIDRLKEDAAYWDFLFPSLFAKPTDLLLEFADEIGLKRHMDPLTLLRWLNTTMYEAYAYVPDSTEVDSPIDQALAKREGVCQDYSHIMTALVRHVGIPCRYVSGYLFHRPDEDRSMEDASHSWIEAFLPDLGWIGFDPTNNLAADDRHICVAVGRDYADVPPTRGVFRGDAETELEVGVQVIRLDDVPIDDKILLSHLETTPLEEDSAGRFFQQQQQQQQ